MESRSNGTSEGAIGEAAQAMATWLGRLEEGGVLGGAVRRGEPGTKDGAAEPEGVESSEHERAGDTLARFVVGAPRLEMLRQWMGEQPHAAVEREKRAAIEVCIWMAHSDRRLASEERRLLEAIVAESGLGADAQRDLRAHIGSGIAPERLSRRITHPVLRELLLALCWELALSDGRVEPAERHAYFDLAERLEVRRDRAEAVRHAVSDQLGSAS
jgi:tellurite resistance protein